MSDKKEEKKEELVSIKFDYEKLDCRIDSTCLYGIQVEAGLDKDGEFTGYFIGKTEKKIKAALVKAKKAK